MDKKSPPPADVINLRAARKARAKAEHATRGAANAARHGQSKADRTLDAARREKSCKDLDAHRRESDPQDGDCSDN